MTAYTVWFYMHDGLNFVVHAHVYSCMGPFLHMRIVFLCIVLCACVRFYLHLCLYMLADGWLGGSVQFSVCDLAELI